jgi:hypothetical protein
MVSADARQNKKSKVKNFTRKPDVWATRPRDNVRQFQLDSGSSEEADAGALGDMDYCRESGFHILNNIMTNMTSWEIGHGTPEGSDAGGDRPRRE